jgi:acyl-CoA reductase-like NAD-dependent aldehyde dehydrogenase
MLADADLISIQEVRTKVEKAYAAFQQYRTYSQERVDAIVEAMAAAARAHSQRLAELAVEETSYGNAKDKLAKNLLCADLLPRRIRGMKAPCRQQQSNSAGRPESRRCQVHTQEPGQGAGV